jgi:phospholipid/cholesterol/gamma-HCH transport system ATP-binding protein
MRFPLVPRHPSRVTEAPLVEIDAVRFGYGRSPVLKGISMSIPRGRIVAIMGGSGCGKTTLLRLVSGQLRPTEGAVRVAGETVHELDREGLYRLRRRMSMLFQFGALFTDLSVYDNVAFPLREHTDLSEQMVRDLVLLKLEAVGLRGAHNLMPSELSGGMARRVLYDEPFAGLDPISMSVVGSLIRRLNDALGATSILVTHDVVESMQIVDYLYFVADGRVVGEGTPAQIRASAMPVVHQFVHGETDGPVPFHYPAPAYEDDVGLAGARGAAAHA